MLALRGTICNQRWEEIWSHQQRWRKDERHAQRQQRNEQQRSRLICDLKQQMVCMLVLLPSSTFASKAPAPKGRTDGQKRWRRHTFSRKALHFTSAKK
jgi:hypothetical protein